MTIIRLLIAPLAFAASLAVQNQPAARRKVGFKAESAKFLERDDSSRDAWHR